ncbi:hypothetical protein cyc_07007 [Cyclospora cayetanensis]|uniref:Transmembrane protein n=1 Tax=Cyclospora cayetanensis TaxID=88456 RepID=A0A1D3CY41_9EIME|nr:hypothetical protein cyc_07007 [Cyclospora cayetanensis]
MLSSSKAPAATAAVAAAGKDTDIFVPVAAFLCLFGLQRLGGAAATIISHAEVCLVAWLSSQCAASAGRGGSATRAAATARKDAAIGVPAAVTAGQACYHEAAASSPLEPWEYGTGEDAVAALDYRRAVAPGRGSGQLRRAAAEQLLSPKSISRRTLGNRCLATPAAHTEPAVLQGSIGLFCILDMHLVVNCTAAKPQTKMENSETKGFELGVRYSQPDSAPTGASASAGDAADDACKDVSMKRPLNPQHADASSEERVGGGTAARGAPAPDTAVSLEALAQDVTSSAADLNAYRQLHRQRYAERLQKEEEVEDVIRRQLEERACIELAKRLQQEELDRLAMDRAARQERQRQLLEAISGPTTQQPAAGSAAEDVYAAIPADLETTGVDAVRAPLRTNYAERLIDDSPTLWTASRSRAQRLLGGNASPNGPAPSAASSLWGFLMMRTRGGLGGRGEALFCGLTMVQLISLCLWLLLMALPLLVLVYELCSLQLAK